MTDVPVTDADAEYANRALLSLNETMKGCRVLRSRVIVREKLERRTRGLIAGIVEASHGSHRRNGTRIAIVLECDGDVVAAVRLNHGDIDWLLRELPAVGAVVAALQAAHRAETPT